MSSASSSGRRGGRGPTPSMPPTPSAGSRPAQPPGARTRPGHSTVGEWLGHLLLRPRHQRRFRDRGRDGSSRPSSWQPVGAGGWAIAATPLPSRRLVQHDRARRERSGRDRRHRHPVRQPQFALRWTPAASEDTRRGRSRTRGEYEFVGYSIANGTGSVAGWVRRNVGGSSSKDAFVWTAAGTFPAWPTERRGHRGARHQRGRPRLGLERYRARGGTAIPPTWTCRDRVHCANGPGDVLSQPINFAMSVNDAGDIAGPADSTGSFTTAAGDDRDPQSASRVAQSWLGGEWRWDGRGGLLAWTGYDAGDALVTARVQRLSRAWPGSVPVGRLEVLP